MNHHKILLKSALAVLCAMSLGLTMGCPDKDPDAKITPPTTPPQEVTLQMIYDEAAKGANATLKTLGDMYKEKVTTKADGDALIKIKTDGENIICKLVQLPAVKEPREILVDLVTNKLTDATAAINEDCKNSKQSLDHMIDARTVTGDNADDADDIIKTLVEKGDDKTVGRAGDKAKIEKVLGAAKKKGDEPLLTRILKQADAGLKADMIAWSAANITDAKVIPAMRGAALVTDDMVVTEAQKGAAANTAELKFLYDVAIDTDAKAAGLAAKPAAVGSKFPHLLAQIVPDANVVGVWTTYLNQVSSAAGGGGGDAAIIALSRLADPGAAGAANYPLNRVLAHVGLAAPAETARNQIAKLLVAKDIPGLTADVEVGNVGNLLTAMRSEETQANFRAAFTAALGVSLDNAVAWAGANQGADIEKEAAPKPTVKDALIPLVPATITRVMLVDEAKGAAADAAAAIVARGTAGEGAARAKVLARVQNVKVLFELSMADPAGAPVAAVALAAQAPTVAVGGDNFTHFLARLPGTDDTLAIWTEYFTQLAAGVGGAGNVVAQLNLPGAGVTPFTTMSDNARDVLDEDINKRGDIITLMVRNDDGTALAAIVDNEDAFNVLQAVFYLSNLLADVNKVIQNLDDAVMPGFSKWALTHYADDVDDGLGTKTTVQRLFKDEYKRVGRGAPGQKAMHDSLISQAYLLSGDQILRKANEDAISGTANALVTDIEAVDPGQAAARLAAIVARLDAPHNEEPALAARMAVNAQDGVAHPVIRSAVAKTGVDMVTRVIGADFLTKAGLAGNNFDPFGVGSDATVLYAVLAKAKADSGVNLTHEMVDNDPVARDGLASTLRLKVGVPNWQAYLDNNNNLATNQRIRRDLVRPDAGTTANAKLWLHYDP